jgi:hypothetical protein
MGGVFLVGSKSEFFKALDLRYGWLFVEGCQPSQILNLEQGRQWLKDAVGRGRVTSDEAQTMESAMVKAGLAENLATVFDQARRQKAAKTPEGFTPAFRFEICEGCQAPLPHGYVRDKDSRDVSGCVSTLVGGFLLCDAAVMEGKVSAVDAVAIFHQMLVTDLPVDDEAVKKLYDALPVEKRAEFAQARLRATSLDLGFGVEMFEIPIPIRDLLEHLRRGE